MLFRSNIILQAGRGITPLQIQDPLEIQAKQLGLAQAMQNMEANQQFKQMYGMTPAFAAAQQKIQLGELEKTKAAREAQKAGLEAGLALGATQWKTVSMVVVPAAKSGLLTAVILGVARIAGETAPLIFTLGGADALNLNPLNGYNSALPLYVWKGFLIGLPEAIQRAWSAIFVLLLIVLTLFLVARSIGPKRARKKL